LDEERKKHTRWMFAGCCGLIILAWGYMEFEQAQERNWMNQGTRRCELCQSLVYSAMHTRSKLWKREVARAKKEGDEPKGLSPDIVTSNFCEFHSVEKLLKYWPIQFSNDFETAKDPGFLHDMLRFCRLSFLTEGSAASLMTSALTKKVEGISQGTLVQVTQLHVHDVCGEEGLGVCTTAELDDSIKIVDTEQKELQDAEDDRMAKHAMNDISGGHQSDGEL